MDAKKRLVKIIRLAENYGVDVDNKTIFRSPSKAEEKKGIFLCELKKDEVEPLLEKFKKLIL